MAKRTRSHQHEAGVPNTREEVDEGNPDLLSDLPREILDLVVSAGGPDFSDTEGLARDRATPAAINAQFKAMFAQRFGPRDGDEASGNTLPRATMAVAEWIVAELPRHWRENPWGVYFTYQVGHRVLAMPWAFLYSYASARSSSRPRIRHTS